MKSSRPPDPTTTKTDTMAKTKAKTAKAKPAPTPASPSSPAPTPASTKPKAKVKRAAPEPMPPHVLTELAEMFNEALERKGWTAYRLAKEAQIDFATIYKFLKGNHAVSMTTFARCLDVLGIRLRAEDRENIG